MTSSNDKGARQTGGRPSRGAGTSIKAVRGTRDLLPDQTPLWNRVEATARALFARYGFGEIRTPVFEATELFARGVGEETDIVSKEMFTWLDGERFNERRLSDAWQNTYADDVELLEYQPASRGFDAVAMLSSGEQILVEFSAKADYPKIRRFKLGADSFLASDPEMFRNRNRTRLLLVIPEGKSDSGARAAAIEL